MVVVVQQSSAECIAIFTVSMYGLTLRQKPPQINSETDTKTMPASKTEGQCACNTLNTLILFYYTLVYQTPLLIYNIVDINYHQPLQQHRT